MLQKNVRECIHTHRCTHSPCVLLDCFPLPFVGSLPSLSPSAILLTHYLSILPALFSLVLSLIGISHSVTVLSIFLFLSDIISSSLSLHFSHTVSQYGSLLLLLLLLFLWPCAGLPCQAAGQCGSETGCNYFTPPLTAMVKGGGEGNKRDRDLKQT